MKQPMGSYDAIKGHKDEKESTGPLRLNDLTFYVWGGAFLMLMLCSVPIWNMAVLLSDFNYVFWGGIHVPRLMMITCVGFIFLYVVIASAVLRPRQSKTPETIVNLVTMFITLLGFSLIIFSIPLQQQVDNTTNNLLYHCQESEQTHRTFEFVKVLQNIRKDPECAKLWSVEECQGYEEANPYTDFIRDMENNFKCSGFCTRMKLKTVKTIIRIIKRIIKKRIIRRKRTYSFGHRPFGMPGMGMPGMPGWRGRSPFGGHMPHALGQTSAEVQSRSDEAAATAESMDMDVHMDAKMEAQTYAEAATLMDAQAWAEVESEFGQNLTQAERSEALAAVQTEAKGGTEAFSAAQTKMALEYPPTLFSDADYQASCEGMAAREMFATAGDISSQTFYLGVYWVMICALTGILRMSGYCAGSPSPSRPSGPKNLGNL